MKASVSLPSIRHAPACSRRRPCPASAVVHGYESASPETTEASRYTFAWPLGEGMLKPRGASTKGAAVTVDTEPAEEWKRLHAAGLSEFERDRRAILAMAGPYRVSSIFSSGAVRFHAEAGRALSELGNRVCLVSEDRGTFIALQHVLVMRILQKDGSESEPFVTRHWRQEWRYEADTALVTKDRTRGRCARFRRAAPRRLGAIGLPGR